MWACNVCREKNMLKKYNLEWGFWDCSICFMESNQWRAYPWHHLGTFEEFCKPQSNEVRARFDLLTDFWKGERSVDEWYNAVQTKDALAKYPQETAKILHRNIFRFFLKDEKFVSKTTNDSNIDLSKFPARKIRHLAKKMESSKATAQYIKQVACVPQAAQINLMCHQCTDLPPSKFKRKTETFQIKAR